MADPYRDAKVVGGAMGGVGRKALEYRSEQVWDPTCSATTLRRRRDEWITLGLAERLSYHTAQAASKAPIMSSEEASLFSVP